MYRVGVTGPSQYTGGYGSQGDFHADIKFSQQLPEAQRVELLTQIARKKAGEGRFIEFSNQGVAGLRFDPNSSLEDRTSLYRRAAAAHAPRGGFDSIDYYSVGDQDKNRFGKSAEGAPIYLPTVDGGKISTGTGGGYGNYAYVTGPDGNVLVKTGHGDTRFAGVKPDTAVATKPPAETVRVPAPVASPEPVRGPAPVESPEPEPVDPVFEKQPGTINDKEFFRNAMKQSLLAQASQEPSSKGDASAARAEIAADMNKRRNRMAQAPIPRPTSLLGVGDVLSMGQNIGSAISKGIKSAESLGGLRRG